MTPQAHFADEFLDFWMKSQKKENIIRKYIWINIKGDEEEL